MLISRGVVQDMECMGTRMRRLKCCHCDAVDRYVRPGLCVHGGLKLQRPRLRFTRALPEGIEDVSLGVVEVMPEVAEVEQVVVNDAESLVAKDSDAGFYGIEVAEEVTALPSELLEEPLFDQDMQVEDVQEDSTTKVSLRTQSLVFLNVMAFLMATNSVVVKDVEAILDPFTFSALRFFISSLCFASLVPSSALATVNGETIKAGLEVGLWSTLGYLLQTVGLQYTNASTAGFLGGTFVVIVPILVGLSGKGISKLTLSGAALSIVGTSLLEQGSSMPFGIGDICCLLSATCFAVQILRTEAFTKSMSSETQSLILLLATAFTTVASTGLALWTHPTQSMAYVYSLFHHATDWSTSVEQIMGLPWLQIAYTGFFCTFLVLAIEVFALQHVTSTDAAIVYAIQPVMAGLLAFFFLGEQWTSSGLAGAALILLASLGTQLLGSFSDRPQATFENNDMPIED